MRVGACTSCGAAIIWAVTEAGKRTPVDAKAERRIVLDDTEDPPIAVVMPTHQSHWASCPNAAAHRRPRTP